jgi:hypothetical protein
MADQIRQLNDDIAAKQAKIDAKQAKIDAKQAKIDLIDENGTKPLSKQDHEKQMAMLAEVLALQNEINLIQSQILVTMQRSARSRHTQEGLWRRAHVSPVLSSSYFSFEIIFRNSFELF